MGFEPTGSNPCQNVYLLFSSLPLGIIRIGQDVVNSLCPDNVTKQVGLSGHGVGSRLPIGQHYKDYHGCALSQVDPHPYMALDVARA